VLVWRLRNLICCFQREGHARGAYLQLNKREYTF
jgi:hypothetical protein